MTRQELLDVLSRVKREDGEKYGIVEIGLFGSFARDAAVADSDVDICVRTLTPDPFVLVHLKEDLEARFRRHVDIVRVREKMNPFLKSRIDKEGVYV